MEAAWLQAMADRADIDVGAFIVGKIVLGKPAVGLVIGGLHRRHVRPYTLGDQRAVVFDRTVGSVGYRGGDFFPGIGFVLGDQWRGLREFGHVARRRLHRGDHSAAVVHHPVVLVARASGAALRALAMGAVPEVRHRENIRKRRKAQFSCAFCAFLLAMVFLKPL